MYSLFFDMFQLELIWHSDKKGENNHERECTGGEVDFAKRLIKGERIERQTDNHTDNILQNAYPRTTS